MVWRWMRGSIAALTVLLLPPGDFGAAEQTGASRAAQRLSVLAQAAGASSNAMASFRSSVPESRPPDRAAWSRSDMRSAAGETAELGIFRMRQRCVVFGAAEPVE